MAKRTNRAKRALPESFKQRSTKSGGGKVIKENKPKKKSGFSGFMPGTTSKPAVFGGKVKKKGK